MLVFFLNHQQAYFPSTLQFLCIHFIYVGSMLLSIGFRYSLRLNRNRASMLIIFYPMLSIDLSTIAEIRIKASINEQSKK